MIDNFSNEYKRTLSRDVVRAKFGELIGISTVGSYCRYYSIAIVEGIIGDFTGEKEGINGINIS